MTPNYAFFNLDSSILIVYINRIQCYILYIHIVCTDQIQFLFIAPCSPKSFIKTALRFDQLPFVPFEWKRKYCS